VKVAPNNAAVEYVKLSWPDPLPDDLEAVAAVPDAPGEFIALSAWGDVHRFSVDEKSQLVTLRGASFRVPDRARDPKPEFEGFALQSIGGRYIAVWAERGWNHDELKSRMWWSTFDPVKNTFGRVPAPVSVETTLKTRCKRHISDIKIDLSGRVFVSSATDCDDTNRPPFESAAFEIGRFIPANDGSFTYSPLDQPQLVFAGSKQYKIEALEFLPGTTDRFIFGTDDELEGGRIFVEWR